MQLLVRERRSPARRGGIRFAGARTRDAPVYASPEEDDAEDEEDAV